MTSHRKSAQLPIALAIVSALLCAESAFPRGNTHFGRRLTAPTEQPAEQAPPEASFTEADLPAVWTFETALAWTLARNNDISEARNRLARQRGAQQSTRAEMLPSVSLVADADRREASLIDLSDRDVTLDPRTIVAQDSYNTGIEIRQSLFDGLQSRAMHKAEKLKTASAEATYRDIEQRIFAVLRQTYDGLLVANESLEIRQESIETYERLLTVAQKRYAAGDVAELEPLRIEVQLKRAQAERARAESTLVSAEERFYRLLNLPRSSVQRKPLVADGQITAERIEFDLSADLENALHNRLDLTAAEADVQASAETLKAARRAHLPKVDAVATYGVRSSYYTSSNQVEGWRIAIVGRMNIFDSFRSKGIAKIRQADLEMAKSKRDALAYSIESQLFELHSRLEHNLIAVESQQSAAALGARALKQAEQQYEIGQTGLQTVLDAQTALSQAQIELAQAVASYSAIVSQIDYSVGRLANRLPSGESGQ